MKVLVVDVGGNNVKLLATGCRSPRKVPSGSVLIPQKMVEAVRAAAGDWQYDVVSIGFPAPVRNDRVLREPVNLGQGWLGFDFAKAFGMPVKLINDAAMQALGSYDGGRMLFLGLGTGLGSALVADGEVLGLELAHLPFKGGKSFEQIVGAAALKRAGKRKWRKDVFEAVKLLKAALVADYVVLGGGNVKKLKDLPSGARRGTNDHAFIGGFRLWTTETSTRKDPVINLSQRKKR